MTIFLATTTPIWIDMFDFCTAFVKENLDVPWLALLDHGVCAHIFLHFA